jgi:hypothetical protein
MNTVTRHVQIDPRTSRVRFIYLRLKGRVTGYSSHDRLIRKDYKDRVNRFSVCMVAFRIAFETVMH